MVGGESQPLREGYAPPPRPADHHGIPPPGAPDRVSTAARRGRDRAGPPQAAPAPHRGPRSGTPPAAASVSQRFLFLVSVFLALARMRCTQASQSESAETGTQRVSVRMTFACQTGVAASHVLRGWAIC